MKVKKSCGILAVGIIVYSYYWRLLFYFHSYPSNVELSAIIIKHPTFREPSKSISQKYDNLKLIINLKKLI